MYIPLNDEIVCPPSPPPVTERFAETALKESLNRLKKAMSSKSAEPIDPGALSFSDKSDCELRSVKSGIHHGFVATLMHAYSEHRTFVLSPDHLWMLIMQGIAEHVKQNPRLRSKWSKTTDGQKTHIQITRNDFRLGQKNDWAGVICGDGSFYNQMLQELVPDAADQLRMVEFSTTGSIERTCHAAAALDTCQNFFSFSLKTKCGLRGVVLEGSSEDYSKIRQLSESLIRERCTAQTSERWLPALLPVLDEIVDTAKQAEAGDPTAASSSSFWNDFCKIYIIGAGSGKYTKMNGWVNVFLPYTNKGEFNENCAVYVPGTVTLEEPGTRTGSLPSSISKVPMNWEYLGTEIPLELLSGFFGIEYIESTDAVRPILGWVVAKAEVI